VCSIKWVGAFVTALVGVYTVEDLWDKFGDLKMPIVSILRTRIRTDVVGQTLLILF
jgi:dolichyl-phosphate-mannose-protein mannosyltransferase